MAATDLLELLRPHVGGPATIDSARAVQLEDQARRHQVLPLVCHRIATPGWQPHYKQNAMRALAAAALLPQVMAVLQRHGINALALKGVALSQQLYGDPSRRQVGDIDVLIAPEHLPAADRALRESGLTRMFPADELSPNQWRLYTGVRHEFVYRSARYAFRVELHWKLNNCSSLTPGTFDELWARRAHVTVGNASVPVLGVDDLMLHLCVHGGTEAWPKLKWLCDIAQLLRSYDSPASERLADYAQSIGLHRLLLLGVALAWELLLLRPTPVLEADLNMEPAIKGLKQYARRNLMELRFKPGGGVGLREALAGLRYRMGLSTRWRYRFECLITDAVVPETVLAPAFARWPLWALYCAAAFKTALYRIRRRAR